MAGMTQAGPSLLDAALSYAAMGWHVFPVHTPHFGTGCSCRKKDCDNVGKHPRTIHGMKDATTDRAKIESWWEMWPDANVGIACGPSHLVVIDVDPRHGGDDALFELRKKYPGIFDDTVTASTGGGGEHYIFERPGGIAIPDVVSSERYTGALGVGIDVRSNGYIVAPPSIHASRRPYEWLAGLSPDEIKPKRLPLPLIEMLEARPEREAGSEPLDTASILNGVAAGERDWKLFQLASKLRYADVPIDMAYALIGEAAAHSKPPFPAIDARKKVDSAYRRYEPGKGAFVDEGEAKAAEEEEALQPWVDWTTFWESDPRIEDWLVEPIIPRGRQVALYSPAKAGKSLLTLDMAARLATGDQCFDREAGHPLVVVYFDFEMTEDDLYERLEDMGYGPDADLSRLYYYLLPSLPSLDTRAGGARVLEIAQQHDADIVIIDTTSRVIAGPENDADTMRAFYAFTGRPLKADGRTLLRLDHAGKTLEHGQRGTSAKNDDVDLVWQLTNTRASGLKLVATHRRQSWVPEEIPIFREDSPLRHERVAVAWPADTREIAEAMDRLEIPLDYGARRIRKMLREAGMSVQNTSIAAAIRWRKAGGTQVRTPLESEPENLRTHARTRLNEDFEKSADTSADTSLNRFADTLRTRADTGGGTNERGGGVPVWDTPPQSGQKTGIGGEMP